MVNNEIRILNFDIQDDKSKIQYELNRYFKANMVVPVLGSGFTVGEPTKKHKNVPSGQGMKDYMLLKIKESIDDPKVLVNLKNEIFSTISTIYNECVSQDEQRDYLKNYFIGVCLSTSKKELLSIPFQNIYTLNIDDAIESSNDNIEVFLNNRPDIDDETIADYKAEGKTILLITHKLNEIMAVANRCSIIRRGEYFGTVEVAETTKEKLASLMIGKDLEIIKYERSREGKKKILEVSGIYADTQEKQNILHDFNLDVHEREILGIAGVDGNGQQQFVEVLNALLKETQGKIIFDGKDLHGISTAKRKELGLEIIAEDRHKDGLVLDFSVEENSVLENYYTEKFSKNGFLKKPVISKFAKEICEKYDVRKAGDEKISARSMSGGNQQKLIIGRALELDPKLLVTTQPTRGLDVGAINGIHKMLIDYRDKGNSVLLISFDLDEILTLSDRIAVIHNGNIIDVVDNDENVTKEQLGLLMAGVKK